MQISTPAHNGLYDTTREVEAIVTESKVKTELDSLKKVTLYPPRGPVIFTNGMTLQEHIAYTTSLNPSINKTCLWKILSEIDQMM